MGKNDVKCRVAHGSDTTGECNGNENCNTANDCARGNCACNPNNSVCNTELGRNSIKNEGVQSICGTEELFCGADAIFSWK